MTWYAWAAIALIGVSTALVILTIGKPRQPTTPATALAITVTNGLLIWAIVALGT